MKVVEYIKGTCYNKDTLGRGVLSEHPFSVYIHKTNQTEGEQ